MIEEVGIMPTKSKSYAQKYREAHPRDVTMYDRRRGNASCRGYDHQWQLFRLAWLSAHPTCALCGRIAVLVDHIRPITAGGRVLDPNNVRSLDRRCHDLVTANYRRTGINELPQGATP